MNIEKTNASSKISAFSSKEEYLSFISIWKALSSSKKATVEHHVIYNLLLGKSFKKAFTPITNENKIISNSCDPHFALKQALRNVMTLQVYMFEPWESIISKQNLLKKKHYSLEIFEINNADENLISTVALRAKSILESLNAGVIV